MELLLYKHFQCIEHDVGLIKDEIERKWKEMNATHYIVLHIQHLSLEAMKNMDGEGEEENNATNNGTLKINE